MINLINGDCLVESDKIESGSVDLILTDLPYGTMKNPPSTWVKTKMYWDVVISTNKIMQIANRILRKNGKMILFSQEPLSNRLISEASLNISFSYKAIWEKNDFANSLSVNKNMVSFTEDILLFSKKEDNGNHPLLKYFKTQQVLSGKSQKELNEILGNHMAGHYFTNKTQFRFPKYEDYIKLQSTGYFKTSYQELKLIDNKFSSTFNLWEGNKYKSNILKYKKDYNGFHPTQKPILLLEDLIKTFSNENDLVVDLTMGSGSTGVACKNTNRKFIGIELDKKYFDIAKERIDNTKNTLLIEKKQKTIMNEYF